MIRLHRLVRTSLAAILCGAAGTGCNAEAEKEDEPAPEVKKSDAVAGIPRVTAIKKKPAEFSDADYAKHIAELKKMMPAGFSLVIEKPWVVVGDGGEEAVNSATTDTVRWATQLLQKDYFPKNPTRIITIWLFKDKASYEKHLGEIWQTDPGTPFGFYSAANDALFMNIATGGGTLVHEMVHPLMESNFARCPSWFNEGLASLYEQCSERDGKIVGLTNWRLGGLKTAIKADTVPPFSKTMATSEHEFYRKDPGTNYSQSRYLCYYLQERGLLRKFYIEFRKNVAKDPGGHATLKKILAVEDLEKFQKDWSAWVAKLQFRFR